MIRNKLSLFNKGKLGQIAQEMKAGGRARKQLSEGRGGLALWVHDQTGTSGQQVRSSQEWGTWRSQEQGNGCTQGLGS